MSTYRKPFLGFLLTEFLLEPRLRSDFCLPPDRGKLTFFSTPVARAIRELVESRNQVLPDYAASEIQHFIRRKCRSDLALSLNRGILDILEGLQGPDKKYESGCRSALCYAAVGLQKEAMDALHFAKGDAPARCRHHHIYGLLHALNGRPLQAVHELRLAEEKESDGETRLRIRRARLLLERER